MNQFDCWNLDDFFGFERSKERWIEIEIGNWESNLKGQKRHPEICKGISEGRMGMKFSDEHRKNLSLSHRGKKQPCLEKTKIKISAANKGKKRSEKQRDLISEKTREKMKQLNQETYRFISPTGEEFLETTTLAEFARKHNLSKCNLSLVLNGKRKQHKGWKVFFPTSVDK